MGSSYLNAEKRVDNEIEKEKRKKEIEMLEDIIRGLTEDPMENGFTEEQMFLMKYYGIDEKEAKGKQFDISNVAPIVSAEKIRESNEDEEKRSKLETNRYNALIDVYSAIEEFGTEKIKGYKEDCFHSKIKDWNEYTEGFEQEPLIIQKMRNLQMINRMAHGYEGLLKSLGDRIALQINDNEDDKGKRTVAFQIEELFSKNNKTKERAIKKLTAEYGNKVVDEWKNNSAMKYCVTARRWMFNEKTKYLHEVLEDLKNSNEKYNYGIGEDNAFIFDVPRYGQFSVHIGKNDPQLIDEMRHYYGVKSYEGEYLGNVYILSKADEELIKNVNYEELSEADKQRYRIVTQQVKGETSDLEKLIKGAKDKERVKEIIETIKNAGLDPEKVVTKTLIDRGRPEVIKDVIEAISQNEYGIDIDILTRCRTMLSGNKTRGIEIMEMLDEIKRLGLEPREIVNASATFLIVSNVKKLEPIYEMLKQYKIDLTNYNIGKAFEGRAENIKKNMDLVIENGLYDLAKNGVDKFFVASVESLNMRMNLLEMNKEPLIKERDGKRKINAKFYKAEADLMKIYGISKKEVLEELSRIKGQELIKDNRYYIKDNNEPIILDDKQQEISNSIYEKLKDRESKEGMVIKIDNYFYSAIKVKEQIDSIIANLNIQDLEKEDADGILKIALFKNKNIDQEEINKVSEKLQEKDKVEETSKEENDKQKEQYEEIRNITIELESKRKEIEDIKQCIADLKKEKKDLKRRISEMEEKIGKNILENQEPSKELIEDIKEIERIVAEQKEKIEEVKDNIKKYKKDKKNKKSELKDAKQKRNEKIDDLEL